MTSGVISRGGDGSEINNGPGQVSEIYAITESAVHCGHVAIEFSGKVREDATVINAEGDIQPNADFHTESTGLSAGNGDGGGIYSC